MEDERAKRADWDALKARLARAREILERSTRDGADSRRARILADRARAIAEAPPERAAGEELEVLEFSLGTERYAVETAFVTEAHVLKDYTPIPCAPEFVLGIFNARGRIVSIVDLRPLFGLPRRGLGNLNRGILLRAGAMEFAILADAVQGTRRLPLARLKEPLPTHAGAREKFLRAIGPEGLLVLDARKLLTDETLVVRQQADHVL